MCTEPNRIKAPRTPHLPWSSGGTDDDLRQSKLSEWWANSDCVVTEKVDGSSATIYWDGYFHARSTDSQYHESQWPVRQAAQRIAVTGALPDGWRIQLENCCFAQSISYSRLPSHLLLLFVWDDRNTMLDWKSTLEWCATIKSTAGLERFSSVPSLYEGTYDESLIRETFTGESVFGGLQEGYVLRSAGSVNYDDFGHSVAKFVRPDYIQVNWRTSPLVKNKLSDDLHG